MLTLIVEYCITLSLPLTAAILLAGNKSTISKPLLYANLKLTANLSPPYCILIIIGTLLVGVVIDVDKVIVVPLTDIDRVLYIAYCTAVIPLAG